MSPKDAMLAECDGQIAGLKKKITELELEIAAATGGIEALQHVRTRIENGLVLKYTG